MKSTWGSTPTRSSARIRSAAKTKLPLRMTTIRKFLSADSAISSARPATRPAMASSEISVSMAGLVSDILPRFVENDGNANRVLGRVRQIGLELGLSMGASSVAGTGTVQRRRTLWVSSNRMPRRPGTLRARAVTFSIRPVIERTRLPSLTVLTVSSIVNRRPNPGGNGFASNASYNGSTSGH